MKRLSLIFLGLIFLSSLILLSPLDQTAEAVKSGADKKRPRAIIILVDMSGSANRARRTLYRDAFRKIDTKLGPGDRIIVGTITSRSYIDFEPAVDVEIPKKSIWVNRIQYERKLTETKKQVRRGLKRLLARRKGTPRTEILNSLNIAGTIFHDEKKRKKVLVILSDMLQDSKAYNFERFKISNKYINNVIKYRKRRNLIPNLKGVKVYVAGASAANLKKFRDVQRFWARYFAKCGANYSPHRYGHSLLSFEKGS